MDNVEVFYLLHHNLLSPKKSLW